MKSEFPGTLEFDRPFAGTRKSLVVHGRWESGPVLFRTWQSLHHTGVLYLAFHIYISVLACPEANTVTQQKCTPDPTWQ